MSQGTVKTDLLNRLKDPATWLDIKDKIWKLLIEWGPVNKSNMFIYHMIIHDMDKFDIIITIKTTIDKGQEQLFKLEKQH